LYAGKNVFNQPITWLFCCLSKSKATALQCTVTSYTNPTTAPEPDPLQQHFPAKFISAPFLVEDIKVDRPVLKPPPSALEEDGREFLEEFAIDVYEWLSLVRLESPRVNTGDQVDPFLSRYSVPGDPEDRPSTALCKISWQGFISPDWARQILMDLLLNLPSRSWFSLSATSFGRGVKGDSTECTVMRPPDTPAEYMLWDIHGHE
jgi:ribonucleases P/MRP protein subunit RPP40